MLRGRATPIDVMEPRPDLTREARAVAAQVIERARGADASTLATLGAFTESHPNDAALRNLVYRCTHQAEGGYFVLD
ncbi:MAG: hypothetical protein H0X36_15170 [Sphingomonadaceae bacterium]|nr:hypothetical protein [Sphingomonadaceae bacterium]